VHTIQNFKERAGYDIADRILASISPKDDVVKEFESYIKEETLSEELLEDLPSFDIAFTLNIGDKNYTIKLKKIEN